MQFHDEIEKLQARLAALEAKFGIGDPEPEVEQAAVEITPEYLDGLSIDAIGDLYKAGKISEATLGAAVTRKVFPQGMPAELAGEFEPEPVVATVEPVSTEEAPVVPAADVVDDQPEPETSEPETDPLTKTSGDDEDAGDWTKHGDGSGYPGYNVNKAGE